MPVTDELIISLSNLNKVRSFDPVSGKVTPSVLLTLLANPEIRDTGGGCGLRPAILN